MSKGIRRNRSDVNEILEDIFKIFEDNNFSRDNFIILGSYRRETPTLGDLDFIALDKFKSNIIKIIKENSDKFEIVRGKDKSIYSTFKYIINPESGDSINVDIRYITDEKSLPAMLMHFTGSMSFNIAMRSKAKKMEYVLNEKGVFDKEKNNLVGDWIRICNEKYKNSSKYSINTPLSKLDLEGIETVAFNILGLNYISPKERVDNLNNAFKVIRNNKMKQSDVISFENIVRRFL